MKRKSCVFYAGWLEAMERMPEEQQGEAALAILRYALNGDDTSEKVSPFAYAMLKNAIPLVDKNNRSYINGTGGGAPKGNQNARKKQPENNPKTTEQQPNDNVNVNVNDISNNPLTPLQGGSALPQFIKPSIQQVAEYCRERGNEINPQAFYDFYESKGWMVGKNKMKDWKAAVRNWERSENSFKNTSNNGTNKKAFGTTYEDRIAVPSRESFLNERSTI